MEKIKVYYDIEGNTLTVWFDDPQKEYICEETGEEIVIIKDENGNVIGFEKINYSFLPKNERKIIFETATI